MNADSIIAFTMAFCFFFVAAVYFKAEEGLYNKAFNTALSIFCFIMGVIFVIGGLIQ
ncbi:MAG: hypothetical protein PVF58_14375 [Candidatus Methanofastidiosia archaeon]|jgi:hypothetical protein